MGFLKFSVIRNLLPKSTRVLKNANYSFSLTRPLVFLQAHSCILEKRSSFGDGIFILGLKTRVLVKEYDSGSSDADSSCDFHSAAFEQGPWETVCASAIDMADNFSAASEAMNRSKY